MEGEEENRGLRLKELLEAKTEAVTRGRRGGSGGTSSTTALLFDERAYIEGGALRKGEDPYVRNRLIIMNIVRRCDHNFL